MYWIDILANFMTGFVVRHQFNLKRKLVMEPHLIALYYVRHGTFLPDLIAALPFIVEVSAQAHPPSTCFSLLLDLSISTALSNIPTVRVSMQLRCICADAARALARLVCVGCNL